MLFISEKIFKSLIFLTILFFFAGVGIVEADFGIVTASFLNLRSEPQITGSVMEVIPWGAKVKIEERRDGWLKIRHENRTGYIRNHPKYVNVVKEGAKESSKPVKDQAAEKYLKEAEILFDKIEASEEKLESFIKEEKCLLTKLDEIDFSLNISRVQIKNIQSELSKLEDKLTRTQSRAENYREKVHSLSEYAKKRLVAIYKTHQLGLISASASADSISEIIFRKRALERIFLHDQKVRAELIDKERELNQLLSEMKAQHLKKLELEKNLEKEISIMAVEREKRNKFLSAVQEKKVSARTLLNAYRQAASILNEKLAALRTEKRRPGIKESSSSKGFESLKGLLKMPVKGTIAAKFGPQKDRRLGVDRFCSGISVKADRGEPIHAVTDGNVLFAGWFKGYGNMVIISHGNHYYTVYAYAEEIFKAKGDAVESGEVIATVGDSGSISGPELYFEVRHFGKPVDPLEWIQKG